MLLCHVIRDKNTRTEKSFLMEILVQLAINVRESSVLMRALIKLLAQGFALTVFKAIKVK